jgi:hypothetical protein
LISARSRRKLGGATAMTPFGSLAGLSCDLSRIMAGMVLRRRRTRNRELGSMPVIQPRPSRKVAAFGRNCRAALDVLGRWRPHFDNRGCQSHVGRQGRH